MIKKNSLFSREQDYSLRITAFLASLKKDQIISVNILAKRLHVSKIFASRIVHKLKKAGITGSIQGKYGGVYLKKPASEISMMDVLTALGYNFRLNDCMTEHYTCELLLGCRFHNYFVEQEKLLVDNLRKQKISDFLFKQF